MSPILTPRETIQAYEAARESAQIYEAARASARVKPMDVRVAEFVLWAAVAVAVTLVLVIAAQALGVYPM